MVATGYYVDQGVVLFFYAVMFIMFLLQLAVEWAVVKNEKEQQELERRMYSVKFISAKTGNSRLRVLKVGKLQYFFHRIGAMCCLLQLLRYIDPYGAYGYYNLQGINFYANNITALLIIAVGGSFYLPIDLVYVVSLSRSPPKAYKILFILVGALTIVDANVFLVTTQRWCTALFLIWIATIQLIQAALFNFSMFQLTRSIREIRWKSNSNSGTAVSERQGSEQPMRRDTKSQVNETAITTEESSEDVVRPSAGTPSAAGRRRPRKKEDSLDRALYHMHVFQILANIGVFGAIAGELGVGLPLLKNPTDEISLRDPTVYTFPPSLIYVILQFLALVIILWYSYLPISVLWKPHEEDEEELPALPSPTSKRQPSARPLFPSSSSASLGDANTGRSSPMMLSVGAGAETTITVQCQGSNDNIAI